MSSIKRILKGSVFVYRIETKIQVINTEVNKKLVFLTLFLCTNLYPQNRAEIAMYNIGLGSVFSGVGAVINKEPGEKTGKVFLNGFWKGAIGGYLIYVSINIISKIPEKEQWEYSWAAKIVNAAGTSMVENGASNRGLLEQWHLHIGFNRIELYTKGQFKVKYKIMPVSLVLTAITATKTRFEPLRSLQTGEWIFSDKNLDLDKNHKAIVLGNVMVVDTEFLDNYFLFAHEVIHIYQYYDYNFINTYANKPLARWGKKSDTFKKINNLLYFDVHSAVLRGLYLLENTGKDCHYENFFEYEAEFFARRGNVVCP